jgi:3-oxoacyl-[acyl-carrier-protein] synthase I
MPQAADRIGPPVVVGLGARTSIGLNLRATDAAVRGKLSAFATRPWLRSRVTGEPVILARLSSLPDAAPARDRMLELGVAAAAEALEPWRRLPASANQAIPVVISVPPRRPGFDEAASVKLCADLIKALPCRVDEGKSVRVVSGHEGGIFGLAIAARAVCDATVPVCLVLGVESYMDIETLDYFDGIGRLKRPGEPNGFVPGEGAGAVLLGRLDRVVRDGLSPLSILLGVGRAEEPKPWFSGEATLGQGLTQALQAALGYLGENERTETTYSDMNGEGWRPDEWAYAYLRTARHHGEPLDHQTPASSWGDVGAATGLLLAGIATLELHRRNNLSSTFLLWAASDLKPVRSACLLRRPE